ncbi:hypothetical protein PCASD_14182 [Puccinia coronata f. sp. avenae]|uniref:Uncharacterized protein n=1 Tax=Puccinia coronata f. sp. avenae TaxID=200324 RepID=A0A2N5TEM1_9BASI|nr:hypothetical protein PCASD_14182 [Puccinia coronata f. sp. avenae]
MWPLSQTRVALGSPSGYPGVPPALHLTSSGSYSKLLSPKSRSSTIIDHEPAGGLTTMSRRSNQKTSSTIDKAQPRHAGKTTHPSFEIIRHKSFGTRMHELWIRVQGEFGLSMLETISKWNSIYAIDDANCQPLSPRFRPPQT